MTASTGSLETTCCIAGGGPAGIMLGYLLARAGIDVIVLEKHADFLRDFRGDTIHPSTLELMHELGLLDAFLALPHQRVESLSAQFGAERIPLADFAHLPTRCRFIALMPQWDFLDFLADQARRFPTFHLVLEAEVTGLVEAGGRVTGLDAVTPDGPLAVAAALVVGADGRRSTVREAAGLTVEDQGAPMDVLWFRLSRQPTDEPETIGHVEPGQLFLMLDRGDYWQCALIIAKGSFDATRARGLGAFRDNLVALSPQLQDRVRELTGWDAIKLLTVTVDRLSQWERPGLLCIGDAAHAMSPIGGVGVNLAIQDAVAAANILAEPLRAGPVSTSQLRAVWRRRAFPTRVTQAAQLFIQRRFIAPLLASKAPIEVPFPVRMLQRVPLLRRIPGRLIGLGVRPEHIRSPRAPG